nr:MAG TPA_asm: hypothetical protein [Caudoviricetes sp.]
MIGICTCYCSYTFLGFSSKRYIFVNTNILLLVCVS